ncbi:MAG TPA: HD domain-containing protein [Edaphocola sp.]|nr:HD domain-containing protein [Edaphocola sp.]
MLEVKFSQEEAFIMDVVASAANKIQVDAYLIGGFVRDKVLGRLTKDLDIVCNGDGVLLAETVASLLQPKPKVAIFKTYGTAQMLIKGIEVEFVGARKESYSEHSRNPEVEPGTLEDDQRRRDFTINALAISVKDGAAAKIIDPFDGLLDLKDKIIRTPLLPDQTFSDDPLRMMRAVRFACQLQFFIENACLESIKKQKDRIKIISKERIADELNKIMMSPKPSIGFDLLYKTGLLDIILPQLTALAGTEIIENQGHKDNLYHSFQVLDNIVPHTENLWLRWAALLHDVGKAKTKRFEKGKGWTFHGHELVSARMIPKIFGALKLPLNEKMQFTQKIVSLHHRPIALTKEDITDSAMRRLLFDAGEELDDLMILCNADITSKNPQKVKRYMENFNIVRQKLKEVEEKDQIRNWQPPISGEEIMETFGLKPSKEVGLIKTAIREAILDGVIPNNYEAAQNFMINFAKAHNILPIK